MKTLYETGGCVDRAAVTLGASRPFLWYYLRKLGMNQIPKLIRDEMRLRYRLPPLRPAKTA